MKFNEFLSNNLGWKIFSLVIAIFFWFTIINVTNPKEVVPFTIPLTLDGAERLAESQNVVVKNQRILEGTHVTIKVRGNRLDVEALGKRIGDIQAVAKLGVIYDFTLDGEVLAPIEIIFPAIAGTAADPFEVIGLNPMFARVTLEDIITEEKPVRVNVVGDIAEGHIALAPEVTPQNVKVTGPRSKLNQLEQVSVAVDLGADNIDINGTFPLRLLDKDSQDVTGITCDTEQVDVVVKINKHKKIPVRATYAGEPAEGYVVTSVTCTPSELEIVGEDADMDTIFDLRLRPINIAGLSTTNAASYDVRTLDVLPGTVSIRNGTPNNVTVTVYIERQTERIIEMQSANIKMLQRNEEYSYNITESTVRFGVTGAQSAVSAIRADSVDMSMDVSALSTGVSSVPVDIKLPEGVELNGNPPKMTVQVAVVD